MSNEWFDIAWVNFTKAILHGQYIADDGAEMTVERVLDDEQTERVYALNEKHDRERNELLRELAKAN